MFDKLKQMAKQAVLDSMPSPWQGNNLIRVAIEASEGFSESLWTAALDRELPSWRTLVDVRFLESGLAFLRAAREADACSTMSLTPELFHAPRLRWINSVPGAVDLIGIPEPPQGLCITTSRGIGAQSMAEHALTLLMALRRQLPTTVRNQLEWTWSQQGLLGPAPTLGDTTVAIFGFGCAGRELAKMCKALGMRVIAVRRSATSAAEQCDETCALADFRAILHRIDAVVLTLPLTPATRGLFGDPELRQMRPGSFIVNVARGELIDEGPLASALRGGRLGGAGLDVLREEPPAPDCPLKDCPNLLVTPHLSGNLHKFRLEIAARFGRNLVAFLEGRPLEGVQPSDQWQGRFA